MARSFLKNNNHNNSENKTNSAIQFSETAMTGRKKTNIVVTAFIFLAAIGMFVGASHYGIQHALRTLLLQQAQSNGMDWAHHIEARVKNFSSDSSKTDAQNLTPPRAAFVGLVSDMFSVGNIYQIDIINPDCYCEISFGGYRAQVTDTPHSAHHKHDHGNTKVQTPSAKMMEHVFKNRHVHSPMIPKAAIAGRFPIDRDLLPVIISERRHDILLHHSTTNDQPQTFAEVYHPVTQGDEVSYIIRIMVDLQEQAAVFLKALYGTAAIALLILFAAFSFPAIKYLKTSRQQKQSDAQAHYLAQHDRMTGVYNRNAFQDFMPNLLVASHTKGESVVLFLFNLKNFKSINDYHGHHIGDQILCEFADFLQSCLYKNGYVARLSGDEFVVIVDKVKNHDIALSDLMDIPTALSSKLDGLGELTQIPISAGIVRYPRDGQNLKELMRHADLALQEAKFDEHEHVLEYQPYMGETFVNKAKLRDEFLAALDAKQIEPYYQPIISMVTGKVEGFEALARWNHPEKGILTPYIFEELLADRKIGAMVGQLMLENITADMGRWKKEGVPFDCIGLNVGDGDLLRHGFALDVIAQLAKHDLKPEELVIEVTENCMFGEHKEPFIYQLGCLREAGCYIALDDFGTGFSSITQLKELPCSTVKIDKSFVNDVLFDPDDQSIIKSLLSLGQSMGFKLVLEGIETQEQLDLLRDLGCQFAQGYYYSRPVPASQVPETIAKIHKMADIDQDIKAAGHMG